MYDTIARIEDQVARNGDKTGAYNLHDPEASVRTPGIDKINPFDIVD